MKYIWHTRVNTQSVIFFINIREVVYHFVFSKNVCFTECKLVFSSDEPFLCVFIFFHCILVFVK